MSSQSCLCCSVKLYSYHRSRTISSSILPTTSPPRRPIRSSLTVHMPAQPAAAALNIPISAVYDSHRTSNKSTNVELYSKYKHGVKRKRSSEATETVVQEFVKLHCPV